ncbi:MAG TPA: SDR family oxidoreductase [Deltaproteobacteria bacterium]|nr:SDR family oxidoreductase [Deltaproteobacteria bacterium]HPJ94318.1 SDR family oxidoreductase [Deltaproteobacteria bacterium]HPR52788.1 SDR family oxidoreductase [Deltaproteobacteria bacterium]
MSTLRYGLEDKVIVVTGGSRGIGLEIARELIAQKAKVVICGRKQDSLDAAQEMLGAENVMTVQAHIAKEEDVEALFSTVMDRYARLDVLINNVGMNLMTPFIADTEFSLWQKIIETNLSGTFLCSRRASQIMRNQQGGKIVNVSSIAGRKASPGMGIYGIAKAGIEMLTKVLASELAPFNIQVNAVAPSMVRTEFSKPFWSNPDLYEHIVKTIPLGRIAEPMDVVHPVLFLASDAAGFITGQTIVVDGGATAI